MKRRNLRHCAKVLRKISTYARHENIWEKHCRRSQRIKLTRVVPVPDQAVPKAACSRWQLGATAAISIGMAATAAFLWESNEA